MIEAETHRQQRDRGDATNAGGQPIEAIEPIDRIGDAHQPDHRGQQAEPVRQDQGRPLAAHGQVDGADAHPLTPDGDRHPQLDRQARQGRQGEQIVGQTDQEKTERTGQGGPDQLVLGRRQLRKPPQPPDDRQGDAETEHDPHPTEAHHRRGVLLARIGGIGEAIAQPQAPHQGHHRSRDQRGSHKGEQRGRVWAVGERHGRRPLAPTLRALTRFTPAAAGARRHRGGIDHRAAPPARGSAAPGRCPPG